MNPLADVTAGIIDGQPVSLLELLDTLKRNEGLHALDLALEEVALQRILERQGVTVSDYELQRASDEFRTSRGLFGVNDTHQWLAERHMDVIDLQRRLEIQITRAKLREQVAGPQVQEWYEAHIREYASARISYVVSEDERVIRSLLDHLRKGDEDLAGLADRYAPVLKTIAAWPRVSRWRDLNPTLSEAIFAAEPGAVLGPIEVGLAHYAIVVHQLFPPVLDVSTREEILEHLFRGWLRGELSRGELRFTLPRLLRTEATDAAS